MVGMDNCVWMKSVDRVEMVESMKKYGWRYVWEGVVKCVLVMIC